MAATSPSLAPRKKRRVVPPSRVVHGDCVAGMRAMPDGSAGVVLADPPYGIGNFSWDGPEGYMAFAEAWLTEAARVLRPGGALLFFGSPCALWTSRMNIFLDGVAGMEHQQTLTWIYSQGLQWHSHSNPSQKHRMHAWHPLTTLRVATHLQSTTPSSGCWERSVVRVQAHTCDERSRVDGQLLSRGQDGQLFQSTAQAWKPGSST